jgi:hypothetical protein
MFENIFYNEIIAKSIFFVCTLPWTNPNKSNKIKTTSTLGNNKYFTMKMKILHNLWCVCLQEKILRWKLWDKLLANYSLYNEFIVIPKG